MADKKSDEQAEKEGGYGVSPKKRPWFGDDVLSHGNTKSKEPNKRREGREAQTRRMRREIVEKDGDTESEG